MKKRLSGWGSSTRREEKIGGRIWSMAAAFFLAAIAMSEAAEACAVCYGAEDSAMTAGMNNAILMLLAVVALVQGSFAALFFSLRQRARRARLRREELQPTHGGTS